MPSPWSEKGEKTDALVAADEFMLLDSTDSNPTTENKRVTLTNMQANLITNVNANSHNIDSVLTLGTANLNLTTNLFISRNVISASDTSFDTPGTYFGIITAGITISFTAAVITGNAGRLWEFHDETNTAAGSNITFDTVGTEKINTVDDATIAVNSGHLTFYSDGSNLFAW